MGTLSEWNYLTWIQDRLVIKINSGWGQELQTSTRAGNLLNSTAWRHYDALTITFVNSPHCGWG